MSEMKSGKDLIIEALKEKSSLKQEIFQSTKTIFNDFKIFISALTDDLKTEATRIDDRIEVNYIENGDFEAELRFSGDSLLFTMHTNVFNFDDNHEVHKSKYVKEDPYRGYCGMIQIYNFLADSFRYNRGNDIGYLIARVFINKEKHFFVEGKRQLGFLYNDFENAEINDVYVKAIIESAILYALDFDLLVPPIDTIREVTVREVKNISLNAGIRTGKRLGFQFSSDTEPNA